ncbi:MAG: hypothetical protein JF614_09750 [Acidobacteria bacterium]|nr:hypothetical protein [Acidobacteriota bacterium]
MLAQYALAWLLTYLLHSTLLLGLAWLASEPLARWSVAAEEAVWKLALVGALLTASLQVAAGWEPVAGRWRLAEASPAVSATTERIAETAGTEGTATAGRTGPAVPVRLARTGLLAVAAPSTPERSFSPSPSTMALALWALGATVLMGGYVRSYSRIRHRLRTRPRVVGGNVLTQLHDLAAEAGLGRSVRLSCSSRVPVPLALGVRQPEICLPPRALAGLTEEQQQGMLAHELAHLVRRDPAWLVVSHLLAAVFFFQPLNWVARRRLREISEMLSDEWAVAFTGRPLSLAGCLAEVAGWSAGLRPLPMPSMADRPSNLARRIRRLLDETRAPEHPARRLWLGAAMVILLIAVTAAAPAVSASRTEPRKPPKPAPAATAPAVPQQADESWLDARPEHDRARHAEHQVAEVQAEDRESADVDVDVDLGDDAMAAADAAMERANASVDEPLEALNDQLASLEDSGLSREERQKLQRELERTTRDFQQRIQPRMEQLSREMSEKMVHLKALDPEMERLAKRMAELAKQLRPSDEALARINAEARKMARDGALSQEEREKLWAEARRMGESMKPTAEQRRQMETLRDEMQKRHEDLGRQFMADHREEIEKAHGEIEREMRGAREELRRVLEQRHQLDREERQEIRHKALRDKMREKAKEKKKLQEKKVQEESDGSR